MNNIKVSIGTDLAGAILFLFFMFWLQSGWYRIDCALGIQKACQLISQEKEYIK